MILLVGVVLSVVYLGRHAAPAREGGRHLPGGPPGAAHHEQQPGGPPRGAAALQRHEQPHVLHQLQVAEGRQLQGEPEKVSLARS